MIKEAVVMKLQKKSRDQLQYIQCTVFRRLAFSQNTVAHFSLALLKFSHAAKKRWLDKAFFGKTLNDSCCVKPIVKTTLCFFCRTFLNKFRQICEICSLSLDSV